VSGTREAVGFIAWICRSNVAAFDPVAALALFALEDQAQSGSWSLSCTAFPGPRREMGASRRRGLSRSTCMSGKRLFRESRWRVKAFLPLAVLHAGRQPPQNRFAYHSSPLAKRDTTGR